MRTLSAQQSAVLSSDVGYSAYWRARVKRASGVWVNLSSLEGRDFLEDCTISESLDVPHASFNLRLKREVDGVSLAPLVTDSLANRDGGVYSPLLDGEREVRLEAAVMPLGLEPTAESDWLPLFAGRIDVADASQGHVLVTGADLSGQLADRWLEAELAIGSVAGVALETVIAQVISAAGLASSWPLHTPVSPAWLLGPAKLSPGSVLETIQRLADQIGWELRLKWLSSANDWRLWLSSPNRTATTPTWNYNEAQVHGGVKSLPLDIRGLRNVVEVAYSDRGDLDAKGKPKRKVATGTVASSYGRRWMRVVESSSSNIDSAAEAQRMADAIVADLSQMTLGGSFEVDHHPALELNDLVAFTADNLHFSADQALAVRAITHRLGPKGLWTVLEVRGKPATSPMRWLRMDARAALGRTMAAFSGPAAPTTLSATATPAGARVEFKAADNGPQASTYELHRSTTSGFTPDSGASSTTLVSVSDTTRFDVTGLTAGTTYYFKVVPRDALENRGDVSSEVSVTAGYIEPRSLQPYVTTASMVPNPDFEASNAAGSPPDTWTFDGVWGTDATLDATTSYSGRSSVKFLGSGDATKTLTSRAFTVRAGRSYQFSLVMKQAAYGAIAVIAQVEWLGRGFLTNPAEVVGVTVLSCGKTSGNLDNFSEYTITDTAPSYGSGGVAAYARIILRRTTATSANVWIDLVDLWRT